MYLSRIYNRYMHGHDILNLIKARAQREPRTECARGPRPLGKTSVFGANPRKEDRGAAARAAAVAKRPISIADVKVYP